MVHLLLGHEDAISSPMVQQYLSASRKRRADKLEGSHRHQAGNLKAKAGVLLLSVSLAVVWRQLQLGRRIQCVGASLVGLSHGLWRSHLAQAMAPANRAAVGVQRLLSRADQPRPDLASQALSGCNARILDKPRVWYRPGTWFSRTRTPAVTAMRVPVVGGSSQELSSQSPSPPWLTGTAPTPPPRTRGARPQSMDLSLQSATTMLTPPGVQPPVPSARINVSTSEQNFNRHFDNSPPLISKPATHSMPTSPKHSLYVNGLWDAAASSSSGGAFAPMAPGRPPFARKPVAPKADYLTAPTCSFKAWQSGHTAEATLTAIDCASASAGGGSCNSHTPVTLTGGGVSFRTTVSDAAELQPDEAPLRSLAKHPAGSLSALP